MLPPRIFGLLVLLFAVQGLCKPTKSTEEPDYEDDPPFDEDDEDDEEDENDNTGTAKAPPQILSEPMSIRVPAGYTIKLPCDVIHTEDNVVAWMKDDEYLYVESQVHTSEPKRIVRMPDNSLVISNVSVADSSDNYKCSILRKPDPIDLIHRVLVDEIYQETPPPQHSHKGIIRVLPSKRVEVNSGQPLKLGCETDIQPPPEIKWFIKNKKVNDPNVILDGNYIMINKVNESHSGLYQCLAEDRSVTPPMEAITVIVHYKPKIEVEKSVVYSGEGIESELTCIVNAYPEAIVTWHKGDKKLTHKKGSVVLQHGGTTIGNKTKHVLKILHTSIRDFGEYKCRAQNPNGHDTKSITLTGVPSPAMIYGAEETKDETGIILKWRLESYSPIIQYQLLYRRKGEQEWNVIDPEVKEGKGNQFMVEHPIRDLQPGSYEAILKARNSFGWSLDAKPHTFTGDYPPDLALKEENSATIRSPGTLLALILVVLSCAFTSLQLFT